MSIDTYRRTGRTTRMLLDAWEAARRGKDVLVIYGRSGEHAYMKELLAENVPAFVEEMDWMRGTYIHLKQGGSIQFLSMSNEHVNIRETKVTGYPSMTPVFVDHYVWDLL